ncbi:MULTISPECIES: hypothetical protein [unclassified Francisella]|uniref:hypothetical protein n=1 Tax=unclassified Francisella TaxID=2610885 RepID=UPI002E2F9096|nr:MULTISPECIES: hypothetical protein [unclassified Francisella]MED7819270.1 hypothetical protein [Francisella sp. 19S2-4]MED7830100.1 hypothetical protein [Francisella sp. 19S2-10]
MIVRKLIIIIGSIFFSLTFLNATTLVINKSAGNMPSSLVPGLSNSESSSGGSAGSLVDSLYDATADEDPFTFTQNVLGNEYTGVSANCTDFKCAVAEINGERWMVQEIAATNEIHLYKEDSDDSITLYSSYEGGTTVDSSREDAEQLQQLVDESITLFNEN